MRALIVDDAKAMRLILRQILTSLGFDVDEASNGREGLVQLEKSGKPDVVLVDGHMPEMDGNRFVRVVRANAAYDAIRMIMVTSDDEPDSINAAMRAGANDYLMKPFTAEIILDRLQRLGVIPSCV